MSERNDTKQEIEFHEVPIGEDLITLIDDLVRSRNIPALKLVDGIITELIVGEVHAKDMDLLVIGEYAEFSAKDLESDKTPEEILSDTTRKRAIKPNV